MIRFIAVASVMILVGCEARVATSSDAPTATASTPVPDAHAAANSTTGPGYASIDASAASTTETPGTVHARVGDAPSAASRQPDSCHGYQLVLPYEVEVPACEREEPCELEDLVEFHTNTQRCERISVERLPGNAPGRWAPRIGLEVMVESIVPHALDPSTLEAVTDHELRRELRAQLEDPDEIEATSIESLGGSTLPFRCASSVERNQPVGEAALRTFACVAIDDDQIVSVEFTARKDSPAESDAVLGAIARMRRTRATR